MAYKRVLFKDATYQEKDSFDFVLDVVRTNPFNLEYASSNMKNNIKIVLTAIMGSRDAIQYASKELLNNHAFATRAVMRSNIWNWLSDSLKRDREIAVMALEHSKGVAYTPIHKSRIYKDDKDLALLAVSLDGDNYILLEGELRNDQDIRLAAIKSGWNVVSEMSDELKTEPIMHAAMIQNKRAIIYAPEHLKNSIKMLFACDDHGKNLMN
jgi:hypothetical protein